jgi:predicted metalloprotease with PDZ domain
VASGPLDVWMSRSSPGRYALHEFAKNVYGVKAADGRGRTLAITRPNAYSWRVSGHDGTVKVSYTLFADRADGTYSGIDNTHAHLNMPATFMWAKGQEERPIEIRFRSPDPSWKIATQLAPTQDSTVFTAPGLQYFMDSPTEISDHAVYSWSEPSVGGAETIQIAMHHAGTEEEARAFVGQARKVVAEEKAIFGELPRYDFGNYTFLADYLPWVSGDGMEHRNSTVIISTRPLSTGALGNLSTLAHEYFHSWNMERIRSKEIEPFDFTHANMSGQLWFGEGFTQYYTALPMTRAGALTLEEYARSIGGAVNAVVNSPGRNFFSAVEMSQHAPFTDAATALDPVSFTNTFISYYTWGNALGLGLDLTLREKFGTTLDDYMRAMWRDFGKPQANQTPQRPYTLDDLRAMLGTVAGDTAFANDFFRRYVTGREVMDYASLLTPAGLVLRRANSGRAWVGNVSLNFESGRPVIATQTRIGTPLYDVGVDAGTTIDSIDGRAVSSQAEWDAVLAAHRPGDQLEVAFTVRGESHRGRMGLVEDPTLEIVTFESVGRAVTPEVVKFRESWVGSHAR